MASRVQVGSSVGTASVNSTSITSSTISSIAAGACVVMGVRALATSAGPLVLAVSDSAGGAYTVVPATNGNNFYSFLVICHNHPGGTNVVLSGVFSGTTVNASETTSGTAVFSGTVGEGSPIKAGSQIITTAANTALNHARTLGANELSVAIQSTYYSTSLAAVSPATSLFTVGSVMLMSQLNATGSVTHEHTGASGQQVNLSLVLVDPVADEEAPEWPDGSVLAVSDITSEGFSSGCPEATDNEAVTGYRVSQDGGVTWINKGTARTHSHTSLLANTAYDVEWQARDLASNWSYSLSQSISTYRPGATGAHILANTGPHGEGGFPGLLFNDVEVGDEALWFSMELFDVPEWMVIYPDGSYIHPGELEVSFTYQLYVGYDPVGEPVLVQFLIEDSTVTIEGEASVIAPKVSDAVVIPVPVIAGAASRIVARISNAIVGSWVVIEGAASAIRARISDAEITPTAPEQIATPQYLAEYISGYPLRPRFRKQPSETRAIALSFAYHLKKTGDRPHDISPASITVADGLVVSNIVQRNGVITALISGGEDRLTYKGTGTLRTAAGELLEIDFFFKIKEG